MVLITYKNLQYYRYRVHKYLDSIWLESSNRRAARCNMYKYLSVKLNIPRDDMHVKYLTRAQCKQAIQILRPMYISLFGHDLDYNYNKSKKLKEENLYMIKITRHEEFETAHLLPGYDGGCGRLHGHSYKIEVTVEGPQKPPFGMVMDFKDLKKAIKAVVPDHKFVYCKDDDISKDIAEVLSKHNIQCQMYSFITTAENMAPYFAETINDYIHNELGYNDVNVVEVKLWETTNSHATYKVNNND